MDFSGGHKKMRVWQNSDRLNWMIQKVALKKIPRTEFNLRDQIDRAADSICANFVEGYYSGSLSEYLRFLRYGKRSLGELIDWVRRAYFKGFILVNEYEDFEKLGGQTLYLFHRLIASLEKKKSLCKRGEVGPARPIRE